MVVAIARTDEYAFRGDDVRYLAPSSSFSAQYSVRSCVRSMFDDITSRTTTTTTTRGRRGTTTALTKKKDEEEDNDEREEGESGVAYLQNPESVDSPKWYEFVLNADRARKVGLRIVLESVNRGDFSEKRCDDSIREDLQSTEILDDVVQCLFALEAWTDGILPELLVRIERKRREMMTQYLAKSKLLLHVGQLQSSILGVLEIAVFESSCSVGKSLSESNLLDLLDFCVERLEGVNNMKCEGEKWTWNDSDNGEYFSRAMSCLSILRSACDRVSELPLSVIARLVSKHKIHSHLLPTLLLKTPWLQEGEEKVFNDGQWINAKTLSHMPKPEAQVWLCLRALLAEPVCSGRHDYFDPTFERSLTDLKSKLLDCSGRSRLIDQIPQLGGDGLQRAILYHLHEIQRNRRARVETTLCDTHVLTKNMNAMKGKDMNAGDSSQDKSTKNGAFTLIHPIQPPSFRLTVHKKAKERASHWVDGFMSRHSENFDVYATRVRREVFNMFDEDYDVLDNWESFTNTNDTIIIPKKSSTYTVRVQFLLNDNEEYIARNGHRQELLYTFDTNDTDCRLPDANVTLLQNKGAENTNDTSKLVRGERFKCNYLGEGEEETIADDRRPKQHRPCSRSSTRWFSNPRYVRVSVENTSTTDITTSTKEKTVPLKITDLSQALDKGDDEKRRRSTKGGGFFWIACGSLRADTFCVQIRLQCKRVAPSHDRDFTGRSKEEKEEEEGEQSVFFSYDCRIARVVCCLLDDRK